MHTPIVDILSKGWRLLFLRGLTAIIFALLAFTLPGMTIAFLIIYWAIYILFDGAFSLAASFKGGSSSRRWWMILSGLLSVAAGIFCIFYPNIVAATFILILGWICLLKGVLEFIGGLMVRSGWFILVGILSFLFGAWCLSDPLTVAELIVKIVATFALIAGSIFIILALKLRKRCMNAPKIIDV